MLIGCRRFERLLCWLTRLRRRVWRWWTRPEADPLIGAQVRPSDVRRYAKRAEMEAPTLDRARVYIVRRGR